MLLRDKTAIVSGAGSGIGRAVAIAYAREGANVIVSDIADDAGRETVQLIERTTRGARAFFVRAEQRSGELHERSIRPGGRRLSGLVTTLGNAAAVQDPCLPGHPLGVRRAARVSREAYTGTTLVCSPRAERFAPTSTSG